MISLLLIHRSYTNDRTCDEYSHLTKCDQWFLNQALIFIQEEYQKLAFFLNSKWFYASYCPCDFYPLFLVSFKTMSITFLDYRFEME